jgi:hypothetical protein
LQSECKENGLEQRQTQNGGWDAKLLLFLVNSCVQEGVSVFQQKQFEHFLHGHCHHPTTMQGSFSVPRTMTAGTSAKSQVHARKLTLSTTKPHHPTKTSSVIKTTFSPLHSLQSVSQVVQKSEKQELFEPQQ